MKNRFFLAATLFVAAIANAQTQPTTTPTQPVQNPASPVATVLADSSINSAYVSNPEQLKGLTTETLRPEHAFPILGSYNSSGSSAGNVTITLDETNKGIVWIDGLSQGKFKALMKKAPSTYKIPAQKTESGKAVQEGTLFLNPTTKELTIVLGRPFDDTNPTSFLTSSKTKAKAWQYNGVKAEVNAVVAPPSQQ